MEHVSGTIDRIEERVYYSGIKGSEIFKEHKKIIQFNSYLKKNIK